MQKEAQEDEEDFLLGEYHSDDETEKPVDTRDAIGGGNLAPEVLKMLQQMAPSTIEPNEENEPDEIKVLLPPPHLASNIRSSTPPGRIPS